MTVVAELVVDGEPLPSGVADVATAPLLSFAARPLLVLFAVFLVSAAENQLLVMSRYSVELTSSCFKI